jgi:hypothetical protein
MSTTTHLGFQTEIEFELPKGYVDDTGTLHRRGGMRLATAADEILPLRDPRVQQNEAYIVVIVLSRVAYLQRLYEQFNSSDEVEPEVVSEKQWGNKPLRRISAVGEA